MANEISLNTNISHLKLGAVTSKKKSASISVAGNDFVNSIFTVTSTSSNVTSSLASLGMVWLHNLDTVATITGGTDGTNFPMTWLPGVAYPVYLTDNAFHLKAVDIAQVETVTCVADVAASLDAKYFQLSDSAGTVGVWIDVDNSGTLIPAGASALDRAIEVTGVVTGDTATAVAVAVASAINADSEFTASASLGVVTVTQATAGDVADGVDGDTTFTFAVTTQGVTASVLADVLLFME